MNKRILAGLIVILMMVGLIIPSTLAENLRYGSSGSQVNQAQARLAELGYYKGDVDGKFGYSTFVAVKGFQDKNGLKVDGVIGEITNFVLFSDTAIKSTGAVAPVTLYQRIQYGDEGPAVKTVQGLLRNLGYYTKDVEGKFGYSTYQAVVKYQQTHAMKVDGVVGPATWAMLTGGMVPPPPPPPEPPVDPVSKLPYKFNDKGPAVQQIQSMLDKLDYNVGEVDDRYGYLTYQAVRAFQKNNKLAVDGIVGIKTWEVLFGPTPVPASAEPPFDPAVSRLQFGDAGEEVGKMQDQLANLGYLDKSQVDKKFGIETYQAVRAFQKNNGLKVDGICGPDTRYKLFGMSPVGPSDPAPVSGTLPLQYGKSGAMVTQLQTMLAGLGYMDPSGIDSKFGYSTTQAVRSFQSVNKLKVDGVVGEKTWNLLNSGTALPKP